MRAMVSTLALVILTASPSAAREQAEWRFGAFADLSYLFDANDPPNHETRSRGTAWRVNELDANMLAAQLTRTVDEHSPVGGELLIHTGKDDEKFGFSATAPNLGASDWLRHVGRANISVRLSPALQVQGGIFGSLIGYDSLYAKDNLNYTRPWTADFTPYLMMGVNAAWRPIDRLTVTPFVVNGYWHLAVANHAPNGGVQIAYAATPAIVVKQTVLLGPHQSNTSPPFWRFLSDTIVERRTARWIVAFNGQVSAERVDDGSRPRAWWIAAQAPMRWKANDRWSATVRPEIAWDSRGRWTLFEQTVAALTGTVEYRRSVKDASGTVRLEYRRDTSRGPQGGFFDGRDGRIGLTPSQQLLIVGLLVNFDAPLRR